MIGTFCFWKIPNFLVYFVCPLGGFGGFIYTHIRYSFSLVAAPS